MPYETALSTIAPGDKVRFTAERLSVLTAPDRKRLEGRVGEVQGYWNYTRKLTVYFPQDGSRPELRILGLDSRQLERVSKEITKSDSPPETTDAASGDGKLSQEDTDNLFG